LEHLVGGLGTAVMAMVVLLAVVVVAATSLVGVGLLLAPSAIRGLRAVADRERARLSRWGFRIADPPPVPDRLARAILDPTVRRETAWAACHATAGLALGLIGVTLPLNVVRDGSFPLWWNLLPPEDATSSIGVWPVQSTTGALWVGAMGLGWLLAVVFVGPVLAWLQAWPGRRLLGAGPGDDLGLRIAELTATRAAALDAHATELRRIERALHDGAQNRLVGVNVLLGAARRAASRDPANVDPLLQRAQDATEEALAELRSVVRSILPPVLENRSLADALVSLGSACPVPCRVDADADAPRCAMSVEATMYFVAAEALTNIARHSHASRASVRLVIGDDRARLEVVDDGRGGAHPRPGSGIDGARRRVEAHDGTFVLASPPGGPTRLEVDLPCGS
jgi:signal transduction histidine kinase